VPLLDEGSDLIGGEVHTVEGGKTVATDNFVTSQTDLAEGVFFVLVQVTEGSFVDTTS
jgi:hypothetical protein